MILGSGSVKLEKWERYDLLPDWSKVIPLPYASLVTGRPVSIPESMLPFGSVLVRRWRGQVYVVRVRRPPSYAFILSAEGGEKLAEMALRHGHWRYVYARKRWRSLSTIATSICATRNHNYWRYGAMFFGLVDVHRIRLRKGEK